MACVLRALYKANAMTAYNLLELPLLVPADRRRLANLALQAAEALGGSRFQAAAALALVL